MPVIINGRVFTGNNLSIVGNRITIDGKTVEDAASGVVEVRITEGSPVKIDSSASVTCGDVAGDVRAGMEVHCGNVGGNINAGMGIMCGDVSGDVRAGMGVTMGRRR